MNLRNMFKPSLKDGKLEPREYLKKESKHGCYVGRIYCKAMRRVVAGRLTTGEAIKWVENRLIRHGLKVI